MSQFDESKHARHSDGKFASKPHAEADGISLTPAANKLNGNHLNPDGTYSHAELVRLTEAGEVEGAAKDLRDRFQAATSDWATNMDAKVDSRGLHTYIDVNDFLLRVEQDGATYEPQFLTGEDDRVPHYLGIAVQVAEAPEGQGHKILTGEAPETKPEPSPEPAPKPKRKPTSRRQERVRATASPEQIKAAADKIGAVEWSDEDWAELRKQVESSL